MLISLKTTWKKIWSDLLSPVSNTDTTTIGKSDEQDNDGKFGICYKLWTEDQKFSLKTEWVDCDEVCCLILIKSDSEAACLTNQQTHLFMAIAMFRKNRSGPL